MTQPGIDAYPHLVWVRGDRIFFSDLSAQLYSAPLAGGPPVLLGGGLQSPTSRGPGHQAIDDSGFYWEEVELSPDSSFWRMPLDGGAPQMLARMDSKDVVDLRLLDEQVIVVRAGNGWYTIPKQGGAPLAAGGKVDFVIGHDGQHLVWQHLEAGDVSIRVTDATGQPAPTAWAAELGRLEPAALWSDGHGGWYLRTHERLSGRDGFTQTFWHTSASGDSVRIACDVVGDDELLDGVVAGDALYLAVRQSDRNAVEPSRWRLLRAGP